MRVLRPQGSDTCQTNSIIAFAIAEVLRSIMSTFFAMCRRTLPETTENRKSPAEQKAAGQFFWDGKASERRRGGYVSQAGRGAGHPGPCRMPGAPACPPRTEKAGACRRRRNITAKKNRLPAWHLGFRRNRLGGCPREKSLAGGFFACLCPSGYGDGHY